jgi:O-acetyl-ADP-ribose deacetylase (regulator of RNase III)
MTNRVKFILIDRRDHQQVFNNYFGSSESWIFYQCQLADLKYYDCVVTPGNSFGDMSGGFDICVIDLLGEDLQARVFQILKAKFPSFDSESSTWDGANQPVGTSIIIPTLCSDTALPTYLCHTPTMECARGIVGKPNVYMAMTSILFEILNHNQRCLKSTKTSDSQIQSVVLPFMGTGFGEMSYDETCSQIASAYKFFKVTYPQFFA